MKCRMCGRPIHILINQGTGICCEMCRKIETGELSAEQALEFIAQVNPKRLKFVKEALQND
jgi:hypothetical protein